MVGGWWVESEFSDRLWLSSSIALSKPNNNTSLIPSIGLLVTLLVLKIFVGLSLSL